MEPQVTRRIRFLKRPATPAAASQVPPVQAEPTKRLVPASVRLAQQTRVEQPSSQPQPIQAEPVQSVGPPAIKTINDVWDCYAGNKYPPLRGNSKLRQFLFDRYRPACHRVVDTYAYRRMPTYSLVDKEDLYQGVDTTLWVTIPKFDPTLGYTFWQYFHAKGRSFLHGAIIDTLRSLQDFPRSVARKKRELREKWNFLRQIIQREPRPEDFCDVFGWNRRNELLDPLLWQAVFNQSNKADDGGEDSELSEEYRFCNKNNTHTEQVQLDPINDGVKREQAILDCIADEDQRWAVFAYYWKGYTNKEVAKYLRCSVSTALERKNKGEQAIARHFKFTRENLSRIVQRD